MGSPRLFCTPLRHLARQQVAPSAQRCPVPALPPFPPVHPRLALSVRLHAKFEQPRRSRVSTQQPSYALGHHQRGEFPPLTAPGLLPNPSSMCFSNRSCMAHSLPHQGTLRQKMNTSCCSGAGHSPNSNPSCNACPSSSSNSLATFFNRPRGVPRICCRPPPIHKLHLFTHHAAIHHPGPARPPVTRFPRRDHLFPRRCIPFQGRRSSIHGLFACRSELGQKPLLRTKELKKDHISKRREKILFHLKTAGVTLACFHKLTGVHAAWQ